MQQLHNGNFSRNYLVNIIYRYKLNIINKTNKQISFIIIRDLIQKLLFVIIMHIKSFIN